MRLITIEGPGEVTLRYMWLPTFIGLDANLMKKIEDQLGPELQGRELTDETLDFAHERVLDLICRHHPIEGLRDFLDSLKFVTEK